MKNNKLKSFFTKEQIETRSINPNAIRIIVKNNKWIEEEFLKEYQENEKLYNKSFLKFLLAKIYEIELKTCKFCGNLIHYNGSVANALYCSNKCKLNGSENPFSREDVKEKIKNTWIKNYGVDNPAKSKIIQERSRKTCLEKYGVDNVRKSKIYKNKIKQTQIDKYGSIYSQTNEYKQRVKNTNIDLYGVKHKNILSAWEKINSIENASPLFTLDEYQNTNRKKDYLKWKCNICGNEFYAKYFNGIISKKCECQHIRLSDVGSKGEYEIIDFIKSVNNSLTIEHHSKSIPNLYEVDIYIPELKIAIEYNGCYWHNIHYHGGLYHLNKTELCERSGIHLIHIWEYDWKENHDFVKEKLKSIINHEKHSFNDDILKLDRCWYKHEDIEGYKLISIEKPEIIEKMSNKIENCGYLIYQKVYINE